MAEAARDEPEEASARKTTRRRRAPARRTAEAPDEEPVRAPRKRAPRRRSGRSGADADAPPEVGDDHRATTREAADAEREPRTRASTSRRASMSGGRGTLSVDEFFDTERLNACQHAIGYHFRDVSMLTNALTHSSVKGDDRPSYERLEFLGDSVVGLIVSNYLYDLLPDCDEGELTKVKSDVVSTTGLANAALRIGLDQYLAVGRGIQLKDGLPKSLIADVFEAVVGGVYLDRGYEAVRLYVLDLLRPFIAEALSDRGARNFKSVLQQVAQREFGETPRYDVVRCSGPDHARVYEVVAIVSGRRFNSAKGETKKDAEQAAAKRALQEILRDKKRKQTGSGTGGRRRRRSSTKRAS